MADDDDAEDNEGKEDSLTPAEMKLLSCQLKILLMVSWGLRQRYMHM